MKIIITGGAGFIGSNLARELVKRGHTVKVIDNLAAGSLETIADIRSHVIFKKGDVRDYDFLMKEFRGYDAVLHHAALTSVTESIVRPREYHEVNATGALNVLEAALKRGVKKVVFASSCAVYGITPYAMTKMIGEQYCRLFYLRYELKTIILRYFNVYGPSQPPRGSYASVIPAFFKHLVSKTPPVIFGNGRQTRDFIFIEDVVRANLLSLSGKKSACGIPINIGTGIGTSINKLLAEMKKIVPLCAPRYLKPRSGDIKHSVANTKEAKRLLGFAARTRLAEGLEKYLRSIIL